MAQAAPTDEDAPGGRRRQALIEEAQRIESEADAWTAVQRRQAAWWRRWNTVLTVTAAVLAALAGATGLATPAYRVLAGLAALGAALLSATTAGLGASARSSEYFNAAGVNLRLAGHARVYRTTVAPYVSIDEAVAAFEALCAERDKAIIDAPLKLGVSNLARYLRPVHWRRD